MEGEPTPKILDDEIAANERRLREVKEKIVEIRMSLHRDESNLNPAKRPPSDKTSDKRALSLFLAAERDLLVALARQRKEKNGL